MENKVLEQQKELLQQRIKLCEDVIAARTKEKEECLLVLRRLR